MRVSAFVRKDLPSFLRSIIIPFVQGFFCNYNEKRGFLLFKKLIDKFAPVSFSMIGFKPKLEKDRRREHDVMRVVHKKPIAAPRIVRLVEDCFALSILLQ